MTDLGAIQKNLDELWDAVDKIRDKQSIYVEEHHKLERQLVELKTDIHYIRQSQDRLLSSLSKVLFIVGGGFIASIVAFVVGGGLVK